MVYRLLDGTCKNKKIVRCNAAGDPSSLAGVSPCLGPTGLRDGEKDSSEDAGCNDEYAYLFGFSFPKKGISNMNYCHPISKRCKKDCLPEARPFANNLRKR